MSNGCLVVGKYYPETKTMSFELALHQMKKGGVVRRRNWTLGSKPMTLDSLKQGDRVTTEDLLAEDWVDVI